MLCIEERAWFERLRDTAREDADALKDDEQLIRQFLRGDAEGPITRRKTESNYEEDLLGEAAYLGPSTPSVVSTRVSSLSKPIDAGDDD
jgi:phospholipid/cholesterol/gamma-HCH transport system ATP-binding protein